MTEPMTCEQFLALFDRDRRSYMVVEVQEGQKHIDTCKQCLAVIDKKKRELRDRCITFQVPVYRKE